MIRSAAMPSRGGHENVFGHLSATGIDSAAALTLPAWSTALTSTRSGSASSVIVVVSPKTMRDVQRPRLHQLERLRICTSHHRGVSPAAGVIRTIRPVTAIAGAGGGTLSIHGDAGTIARSVYSGRIVLSTAPLLRLSVVVVLNLMCPGFRCRAR